MVSEDGKVNPQRGPVAIAVAKVKAFLGFALTSHEQGIISKSGS